MFCLPRVSVENNLRPAGLARAHFDLGKIASSGGSKSFAMAAEFVKPSDIVAKKLLDRSGLKRYFGLLFLRPLQAVD
ncbi:MAG: hypothetical protein H6821_12135 [Planctomycetaceae bacterium]|nr:hypothetical protein [Planctomycetaceae bacterium]